MALGGITPYQKRMMLNQAENSTKSYLIMGEANASCFRLTSNSIELAREEMITDPNLNLLQQLKKN